VRYDHNLVNVSVEDEVARIASALGRTVVVGERRVTLGLESRPERVTWRIDQA